MNNSLKKLTLCFAIGIAYADNNGVNQMPPKTYPEVTIPQKKMFKPASSLKTATPIKYLVVLFQENNSFDRYFGIYPNAINPSGEPQFTAKPNTPQLNGFTKQLLENNPNKVNPFRLSRKTYPCSNKHEYQPEIDSMNGGLMNKFVEKTDSGKSGCINQVMAYYDGNSVTALWNYAQNYTLNDNTYTTNFGPSTPGAVNLVAGTTGPTISTPEDQEYIKNGYLIEDPNPMFDDCSYGTSISGSKDEPVAKFTQGKNIGDLLNNKSISWGWFQGGFKPTSYIAGSGTAICDSVSTSVFGKKSRDYIPHHEPFNYFASTANPHHLEPSSNMFIGSTDRANHQYDLSNFYEAAKSSNLPAVSFIKPRGFEDGHGGYSNPIDEQRHIVNVINQLQQLPQWKNMAIIIIYDDTDGDYDHQIPPKLQTEVLDGHRGFGGRIPMLVISPWSKVNYIDHTMLDQTSVTKFIEYNWGLTTIGKYTADNYAGSILNMFDFNHKLASKLKLDPENGTIVEN